MCGIFGVIGSKMTDPALFLTLASVNRQRGNLGFGYYGMTALNDAPHRSQLYRQRGPFDPQTANLPSQHALRLGHIKAPTGGRSRSLDDIHPFSSERLLLAHNGLLLNHHAYPAWRRTAQSDVDSQYILGGILSHLNGEMPVTAAIKATVEALDGQQACWLWDKQAQELYLWRVMAPIYFQLSKNLLAFSSVRFANEVHATDELLPEGVVYRFSPQMWTFKAVERFRYHSPYLLS